jgi:hypothetical protein
MKGRQPMSTTAQDHSAGTPRQPHVATYAPEDGGYLVTCPEGCNLGTSAHQPDRAGARRRAELHEMATS